MDPALIAEVKKAAREEEKLWRRIAGVEEEVSITSMAEKLLRMGLEAYWRTTKEYREPSSADKKGDVPKKTT